MQLYRIANGIKNCFKVDENAVVNGETGEVFDADYLDQLKMKKEAKVDNIACSISHYIRIQRCNFRPQHKFVWICLSHIGLNVISSDSKC